MPRVATVSASSVVESSLRARSGQGHRQGRALGGLLGGGLGVILIVGLLVFRFAGGWLLSGPSTLEDSAELEPGQYMAQEYEFRGYEGLTISATAEDGTDYDLYLMPAVAFPTFEAAMQSPMPNAVPMTPINNADQAGPWTYALSGSSSATQKVVLVVDHSMEGRVDPGISDAGEPVEAGNLTLSWTVTAE